jgi:hypothetical protein
MEKNQIAKLQPGTLTSNVKYTYQYCKYRHPESADELPEFGSWEHSGKIFDAVDCLWDAAAVHEAECRGGIAFRVLEIVTIQSVEVVDEFRVPQIMLGASCKNRIN